MDRLLELIHMGMEAEMDESGETSVSKISSFEEAGLLTNDKGYIIHFTDGEFIEVTVKGER